jgi:D-alanyl-D-alanine carboxypeptidase (penicillin-binding protein 5/6)
LKKILKYISAIIVVAVITVQISVFQVRSAKAISFSPSFGINSESAILFSLDTNEIVYSKNSDKQQIPAQLCQIMAAVICLENCDDPDSTLVTVRSELYNEFYTYGNKYGYDDLRYAQIYDGDSLSVTELLYAMMLTSSCEASVVLANYFQSLTTTSFVDLMNQKAKEIGCTNTNFTNATGLYDENQCTTAEDILRITIYALSVDKFEEIATSKSYNPTIRNTDNHAGADWYWSNSNTMMAEKSSYYYEGAKGIKTSNLEQAGRSLVMECSQNGYNYLLILMNAPFEDGDGNLQYYHLNDACNIFDWCFNNFEYTKLIDDTDEIAEIPVNLAKSNDFVLLKAENSYSQLWCNEVDTSVVQKNITLEDNVNAPVKAGDVLGKVQLTYNGEEIATVNLVAISSVKRSNVSYIMYAVTNYPSSGFLKVSAIVALMISLIYIIICLWSFMNMQNNSRPQEPVHIIPRVVNNNKKKKKSNKKKKSGKNVYAKEKVDKYKSQPIKPTKINYDDYDFRH